MFPLDVPIDELKALVLNRDISLEHAVIEYIDSIIVENTVLDLEEELAKNNIARCVCCGYWTEIPKYEYCKRCEKNSTDVDFMMSL